MSDPSKTSSSKTLVQVEDFFGVDKLWASKVIGVARSAGGGWGHLVSLTILEVGMEDWMVVNQFNNVWGDSASGLSSLLGSGFLRGHDGE